MTEILSPPSRRLAPPGPLSQFCQTLAAGRAVHAYLITGARGSGKQTFAKEAARSLLCADRTPSGMYCDLCSACVRTRAGTHPDLHILAQQPKKTGIGVDDVREILSKLTVRAYEGGARVVLIQGADRLTAQAQNALLKSLEEPRSDVTWLLLAADPSLILPTVRSRCRQIAMLPSGDIGDTLIHLGADEAYAKEIAVLSGGAAERARELYDSPAFFACREKAVRILSIPEPADVPAAWNAIREEKEDAQDILLWLECFAQDGLLACLGSARRMRAEGKTDAFTFARWKGIIGEIVTIRKKLASNVPWATAVEPLLWKITEGERV